MPGHNFSLRLAILDQNDLGIKNAHFESSENNHSQGIGYIQYCPVLNPIRFWACPKLFKDTKTLIVTVDCDSLLR